MDKASHQVPKGEVDPLELFEAEDPSSAAPFDDLPAAEDLTGEPVATSFQSEYERQEAFQAEPVFADEPPPYAQQIPEPAAQVTLPAAAAVTPASHSVTATVVHSVAPAAPATPPPFVAAVPVHEPSTLSAWFQRNALSVAALVVACLGSAAILIGMRHSADTEVAGWAQQEIQAPAAAPLAASNALAASPDPPASPAAAEARAGLDGNAEDLAPASVRTDGLDGATGTTAVRDPLPRETLPRQPLTGDTARETLLRDTPAREVPARETVPAPVFPPVTPPRAVSNPAPTPPAASTVTSLPDPPVVVPPPAAAAPNPASTTAAASVTPANVTAANLEAPVTSVSREPSPPPVVAPTARERRESVQLAVNRFRDAYSNKDAAAAKSVFPSVNAKVLGESFAKMERQRYTFRPCQIAFSSGTATATCDGSYSFQPVGDDKERTEQRRWEFTLKEVNREWSIDRVVVK